ncbi:NUDIX domain-containing protein [Bogoriella caseilytica]|uniref:NUDIX domain-containing protein n=1 Tax=Bogoriella caseilytica TaxID=56055 RepID=UPI0011CDE9D8|nr:NUDIX hydrolase [Bogoriella caseilytica]
MSSSQSRPAPRLRYAAYMTGLRHFRMGAGVVIRGEGERVLLVEPTYKENWEIPGGVVEADEAPWATAEREVREELGLEFRVQQPLLIDHLTTDVQLDEGMASLLASGRLTEDEAAVLRAERALSAVMWLFDGGTLSDSEVDALRLPAAELRSVRLCTMDEVRDRVNAGMWRRLTLALEAARGGTGPVLCADGVPRARS